MIVSCPACQTQFNVDPALLGPGGRKVRCAKCAHQWRVGQDGKPTAAGKFGLHAPNAAAAEPAAPETPAEAEADTDVQPAPDTPDETAAPGAEIPGPAAEKPSLWARDLIAPEKAAKLAAESVEAAGSTGQDAQEGEAADAAVSGPSTAAETKADGATGDGAGPDVGKADIADAAAGKAAGQVKRQKGGKKFKIFLLLLCLVVLALFAAAVLTGRFGPGGIVSGPQAPSTGDVAPPGAPGSHTKER